MVMVCSQGRSDSQPANSLPAVLLIPTQNKAFQTTKYIYIYIYIYITFRSWSRMTWKAEFIVAANNCPVLDGTKTQLSYFLARLAQIGDIGSIPPPTDYVGRRPQKPNTKTEVRPGLQLYDFLKTCYWVVFYSQGIFKNKIHGIYNQDQKYNNKNTQKIAEVMKQYIWNNIPYKLA